MGPEEKKKFKDNELMLRKSREMWLAIIDGIEDFIFIIDREKKIFAANRSLAQFAGKHPKELIGRTLTDLFGDEVACFLRRSFESPLSQTEEMRIEYKPYMISSFPLNFEGSPLTICVMKDISEIMRLKEQLYNSYKLASLGLLISGIAHEINNPMTGIVTYGEILKMKTKDPEMERGLEKILYGAERCRKIIDNLLTFSRQQAPSKSLESMNDLIERTIEIRSYWLKRYSIDVVTKYGEIPLAFVDSQQLQHAILNVLINAEQAIVDSGMQDGRIEFTTGCDTKRQRILVEISDNGPGIPKEILSRVFDPFFTTKSLGTGTGLGLSMAYGIIMEHGGEIKASGRDGTGVTFFIEIPPGSAS